MLKGDAVRLNRLTGLITYNTRKLRKPSSCCRNHRHHSKGRETSVTFYFGLKIYSAIRSRTIIDCLFSLEICISYDRILSNTKSIYEILCNSYARHRLFLTRNMEKKCFVILMKFYYFVIIQARTLLQTLFILMTT